MSQSRAARLELGLVFSNHADRHTPASPRTRAVSIRSDTTRAPAIALHCTVQLSVLPHTWSALRALCCAAALCVLRSAASACCGALATTRRATHVPAIMPTRGDHGATQKAREGARKATRGGGDTGFVVGNAIRQQPTAVFNQVFGGFPDDGEEPWSPDGG